MDTYRFNFIPYNDDDALFSPLFALHYLLLLFVIKQILPRLLDPSL